MHYQLENVRRSEKYTSIDDEEGGRKGSRVGWERKEWPGSNKVKSNMGQEMSDKENRVQQGRSRF